MSSQARYTEEDVRAAIASSLSITQALRKLGLRAAGGNFRTMRKLIRVYEIPTDHFDPIWARRARVTRDATPLEQILVKGSHYNRRQLKKRLYASGLKSRTCEFCGQTEEWRGKTMSLILDHINGDATDNRLENLRIVCPNCAATLETHCGRKNRRTFGPRACQHCGGEFTPRYEAQRYCSQTCGVHCRGPRAPRPERRKVERPSFEQLRSDIEQMSFVAIGRKYGVSDNAVRKWLHWCEYHAAIRRNQEGDQQSTLEDAA